MKIRENKNKSVKIKKMFCENDENKKGRKCLFLPFISLGVERWMVS
jgi:hypothetical protein